MATVVAPATIAWPFGAPFGDGQLAVVARSVVDRIGLYGRPGAPLPWRHLEQPNRAGLPLVFLAVGRADDGWLRVKVPLRPNGTTAWIRLADIRLTRTRYHVEVAVAARRLTLRWGPKMLLEAASGSTTRTSASCPGGFPWVRRYASGHEASGLSDDPTTATACVVLERGLELVPAAWFLVLCSLRSCCSEALFGVPANQGCW